MLRLKGIVNSLITVSGIEVYLGGVVLTYRSPSGFLEGTTLSYEKITGISDCGGSLLVSIDDGCVFL